MMGRWLQGLLMLLMAVIVVAAAWTAAAGGGARMYQGDQPAPDLPETVLILGSKVSDGEPGAYVRARLDTAVALYESGGVTRIINSGNGGEDAGRETEVMTDYLVARGVPAEIIEQDPEGLDTATSCLHLAERFDVTEITVVTQDFHLARANALCRHHGVEAVGVIAGCADCSTAGILRNHLRETVLARPRALAGVLGFD